MIIGEAPGEQEDRTGKPFQGRSGKLLNDMLEAAGIDRSECYVTNIVKCRPPENRTPSAAEVKTCKPYLDAEIAAVKPEFILTLGATALKGITKKAKITELHGQQFDYAGTTVVPTFHPAAALRDPARLDPLRKDIVKFGHILNGNVPSADELHWEVIRTMDQWNQFIEEFSETKEVAIDIETTGLDRYADGAGINSIQFGLDTGRNWSLPLEVRDSPWKDKPKVRQRFVETLVELADGKTVIGQNFKFDNLWIKAIYGVKFHLNFDTMLAHHTLDENSPHGLKELASEYCNAPTYDVDLKTKLGQGDLEKFYKYGCYDVYYTLQLYRIFRAKLLKDPVLRRLFYKLVMPAARMFEDVEEEGLFINVNKLAETEVTLTERRDSLLVKMNKASGGEVNWNSPAQIAKLFFDKFELPILEATDKGSPSTSESVLLRLQDKHPVAKMLIEYRGVEKNLSTYVVGWRKLMHGDRLYLSTKLHGTVTGRYASRLHQVPRDPLIRSHIDAPDGWEFVCADYSQIELRLAAMLSNDARMKMIFQTGGDIHSTTASIILGKPIEKLTKEERKMAKAVNFGLLYGMWWPKLVIYARDNYSVDMTDRQAQEFRKRYFETYSALPSWHERQRRCVRAFGQVVSLSGRIRRLPGINSSEKGIRAEAERQGINSPVQGFGSGDLKAMAMVEVSETFNLDEVQIKGEVHDSILMWVRSDAMEEILPKVKAIMEQPRRLREFGINMTVPLVADFEVGPWGQGKTWKF
jgi:DNA polymerase-1